MRTCLRCLSVGAALIAAGLGGCRDDGVRAQNVAAKQESTQLDMAEPAEIDTVTANSLSAAFRGAAHAVLPSVVFVAVEREAATSAPERVPIPEPFRRFFEFPEPQYELPPQRGSGSGFILDEAGHILTNNHVVAQSSRIRVRLLDGREFDAEVVGADPNTDIAVIQVQGDADNLPTAPLGDSDALQVGDWVLALGNPLGLDFTVTAGIVSAKGRQLTGRATALEAFIQTDAAINPGNSGGPLIDLRGRVVGINSAIYGGPRFVGYGFAVPENLARRVADDLIEYGYVRRPRLGVGVSDVTAVDAEVYKLDQVSGAEVNTVDEDSPAAEAGLEVGDVIVAVDGEPVPDATALTTRLAQHQPGDELTLSVIRDGRRIELTATLGEFPHPEEGSTGTAGRPGGEAILGFAVRPLTAEIAARLGFNEERGVVVSEVGRFSAAANAGIRSGQLVLRLNGQRMENVGDFRAIASSIDPGDVVSVRVRDPEIGETIINYRTRG
ncbi:MAG: Do family serine endopeptidase [Gemmatimonadales bacterium]